ncbi:hypothetical protein [Kitasatospora sp. GP82]|uniref:hypothetical protein n=1 Tax=Kitasatospora sp. GP82 TaxID=3035089 RepID=UPI0024731B66|nr:hypothetical protein [Kitasatospora sp. GP82]MDH6125945.1 hypothetical protein [Kitasatospora sp. GP82]
MAMPATTFEQIIARHADMIARLDNRDSLGDVSIGDFIDVIADLGDALGYGATDDFQAAAHDLTMAFDFLTEAFLLPDTDPDQAQLISRADKRLNNVNDLALV